MNSTIDKVGGTTAAAVPKDDGPQHQKLKKATQDFEAVFLGQMLKQMRKSMTGGNALFGNSSESKMFQEMADEAVANQMSKTGSFGLAKTLYTAMARTLPHESAPAQALPPNSPAPVPAASSTPSAPAPTANPFRVAGQAETMKGGK